MQGWDEMAIMASNRDKGWKPGNQWRNQANCPLGPVAATTFRVSGIRIVIYGLSRVARDVSSLAFLFVHVNSPPFSFIYRQMALGLNGKASRRWN